MLLNNLGSITYYGSEIIVASTISGGAAGFGSMCAFVVAVAIHVEEMPS